MNPADPASPTFTPPQRLSPHAVAAAALALASVAGCLVVAAIAFSRPGALIAMFAVPLLGASSVILGLIARRRITRSAGTLHGRAPATFAILVGFITSIIPTAFVLSALVTLSSLRMLAPVAERFALAAAADRFDAARVQLSPACAQEVTDARLAALASAIEQSAGAPERADISLSTLLEARKRVTEISSPSADPAALGDLAPKPAPIRCTRGTVYAYILLDEPTLAAGKVLIDDALFVLPTGQVLTLRPNGPATLVATALGAQPTPLPG